MDKKFKTNAVMICFLLIAAIICLMAYVSNSIEIAIYVLPLALLASAWTIMYNHRLNWFVLKNSAVMKIWVAAVAVMIVCSIILCYTYDRLSMTAMLIPLIASLMIFVTDELSGISKDLSKSLSSTAFSIISIAAVIAVCAVIAASFTISGIGEYHVFSAMVLLSLILPMLTDAAVKEKKVCSSTEVS